MTTPTDIDLPDGFMIHPAADLFPVMKDAEFEAFKEDIRQNGQQIPILVQHGQLIDGRHRYRACRELGIAPKIEEISDGESIERLIISLNQHRRHLSDGQRAMIAARLANIQVGGNQHTGGVSQKQAADDLKVSVASVQRAKAVLNTGTDELIQAVDAGTLDVSNAAKIADLDQATQRAILDAVADKEILAKAKLLRKAANDERRAKRIDAIEAKRANNQPLDPAKGPYSVIYADPPWDYMGEVAVGYPTMTMEEICAMPVDELAAEDAVLFLWCSASLMQEALDVIKAWGFTYKTQAIWDKQHPGQGVYFRIQHEVLMIATRGTLPEVQDTARAASVFKFPRGEHSRKPVYGYELIEKMYPELNKIELFCRGVPHAGWSGWGNECITDEVMQDGVETVFDTDSMHDAANDDHAPQVSQAPRRGRPRKKQ
jgi:N6-adenosine-specific RNA methylase IME4/ParB-like chromosome segregation protein Spo0J